MCVIAVSRSGTRQPVKQELSDMWRANSDGAGFMFARSGEVYIRKGFMTFQELWDAVRSEHFTRSDSVVYHFRISTQAGKTAQMTHPFPLSSNGLKLKSLELTCPLGIAHNGIIPITSNGDPEYSDTALFIRDYLSKIIRDPANLQNPKVQRIIEYCGGWSRFAFMESDGTITTIGHFTNDNGLQLSNTNHYRYSWRRAGLYE